VCRHSSQTSNDWLELFVVDFIVSLCVQEAFGCKPHQMPLVVLTQLRQYCPCGIPRSICFQSKLPHLGQVAWEWGLMLWASQVLKKPLFSLSPLPGLSLFGELVQGLGHMQEVLDELTVEVDKSDKMTGLQSHSSGLTSHKDYFDGSIWTWPSKRMRLSTLPWVSECALLSFQVEPMFMEDV